jgi:hypothetical protein
MACEKPPSSSPQIRAQRAPRTVDLWGRLLLWLPAFLLMLQLGLWGLVLAGAGLPLLPAWAWRAWQATGVGVFFMLL